MDVFCEENRLDSHITALASFRMGRFIQAIFPHPTVSSVQDINGNICFSSGMSKKFGEYDKNGKLIVTCKADKYSYQVLKYKF